MSDINYAIKIKTKEERYLFVQTIFYLVCKNMVENYRKIIKEDIIKLDETGWPTKFKSSYLGRYDGRVILSDLFKLMNPYAVSKLSTLYTTINNNWNMIDGRRNYQMTQEIYIGKCLNFIRKKINHTKKDKIQVDIFFDRFKSNLKAFQYSKFVDTKFPLFIQTYDDDEFNQVLFFLKNLFLVFSFDPFIGSLLVLISSTFQ